MLHWSKDLYLNLIRTLDTLLTLQAQKNNSKKNIMATPILGNAFFFFFFTSRQFNTIMAIHLSRLHSVLIFVCMQAIVYCNFWKSCDFILNFLLVFELYLVQKTNFYSILNVM